MADAGVLAAIDELDRAQKGESVGGMNVKDVQEMLKQAGGEAGVNGSFDNLFGTAFDGKPFDEAEAKAALSRSGAAPKKYYGRGGGDAQPGDGKWHWEQRGEEVHARFKPEVPLTKADVSVSIKARFIKVQIRGDDIVTSPLFSSVVVDECTWCVSGGELQIMLTKQVADEHWQDFLDRSD
mmetsp:Transcript_62289/g.196688  ORF Transcript_62289/g.196688 Transcript_62289/m.196688 type:complete len:181 (-) Transcript_62289:125-667(-)